MHLNYRSRAIEFGQDLDERSPDVLLEAGDARSTRTAASSCARADCQLLNYEGEIAAVVGRPMRRVRPDDVWDHLAGFACANDVGAHDFRDTDAGSMLRVKGQDGFCPIGPGLVSGIDIRKSTLRTFVNGEQGAGRRRSRRWCGASTSSSPTSRATSRCSPGDVVLTGTPWHSRPMFPGDVVEVEVDGIGRLVATSWSKRPRPSNHRGFPATVTKTSLGVALGSDYHVLKRARAPPTPEQYQRARAAS